MRIFVISHEYVPIGTGAANALANLLPRLCGLGHEVCLLTSHFGDLPLVEETNGLQIHRIRCGRKKQLAPSAKELVRFLAAARSSAVRLAEEFNPDIVVAFFTIPAGSVARKIHQKLNLPYVVSLRGSDVPGYDPKRFAGLLRITKPWARRIWRDAAAVVPNSTWLRDLAAQTAPGQAFHIIPNGVDVLPCHQRPRRKNEHEDVRVLYVGQLVPRKGVHILIEALAEHPEVSLDVAGDGPARIELEGVARKHGVDSRITWHGHVSRQGVAELYGHAHIFAMATDAEGMSNSVLEAMAAGLAVVTTSAGAADLIVDGTNGRVIERCPKAFSNTLAELLDESARIELGRKAAEFATQRSWDTVTNQWAQLLGSVVA